MLHAHVDLRIKSQRKACQTIASNACCRKHSSFCVHVGAMGERFCLFKEKRDALALELLKSAHENNMHRLILEIRKLQAEEANKTV